VQNEQTVAEMVDEVLVRQARARVAQTGEPLEEALDAILKTKAGRKLQELREGPHRAERASTWQGEIARAREEERAEYKSRRA
jgi:ketosteroid isomerase-like protein